MLHNFELRPLQVSYSLDSALVSVDFSESMFSGIDFNADCKQVIILSIRYSELARIERLINAWYSIVTYNSHTQNQSFDVWQLKSTHSLGVRLYDLIGEIQYYNLVNNIVGVCK
jgi:hypothetical protein